MRISAIVAISDNLAIGEKDMIPWYLPIDLKYFKDIEIIKRNAKMLKSLIS
jgi:dihydrofolate reductase